MRQHGFTMMELLLVVAITGVLLLGVGVLIEVPRQVAQSQQNDAPVSSALVSIDQLEKDVRFAADVVVPDSKRLQVFPKGAPMIEYEWDGVVGGVLTRTDPNGSVTLLRNVRNLVFGLETVTVQGDHQDDDVDSVAVEAASFSNYTLKAGYHFGGLGGSAVNVLPGFQLVYAGYSAAFFFQPTGLGGDTAHPAEITVRLSRAGLADLHLKMYAADPTTRQPDLGRLVATGTLKSSAIPVILSDVAIPLTATGAITEGESYVVVLGAASGTACSIKYYYLTRPKAAAPATTGYMHEWAGSYVELPGTQYFEASQAPFSFQALTSDVDEGTGGSTPVEVPVAVRLNLALKAPDRTNLLETTFTLQNNVCLANQ